ncbi:glycosyltransferase family 4 protein [Nitrosococcus watsonii]|uniref:Glycosyl transferase group 1 n=1 Tax=Nitrosococcus watsoni (strain C-113) TaxID=105559 RepID=D8K6E1_NITWC|nr:glycosyltransferase family 4 protein [Nitrosococcus watsonii]ADJ28468.1 glycosyl transferase group 1 [Nitrosococcus watsonii C-113]
MKIAQIAPLYERVPPRYYGGTERIVSYLTEELVNQGHDVTLFASGDSLTKAKLHPIGECALRLNSHYLDPLAHHIRLLGEVSNLAPTFDILHFHIDYLHFPLSRILRVPQLTTLHGRLDLPDLAPLYQAFPEMPVVSISNAQRHPLPFANWQATIYHGLPENLYDFHPQPGDYLAFLGRISPEKRLDRAIEIALRAGMEIRIAAKVDPVDEAYFQKRIKPLLTHPLVSYIGEIGEREKNDFLGQAYALLFPIDWPEPFGLVMIEAMACGTPVIAYRQGSVPEVMQNGKTGFIVESLEQAVTAVERISQVSRRHCRQVFEEQFSAKCMAKNYLRLYQALTQPAIKPRLVS